MASERWVVKHSGDWYLSKDEFGTPHKRSGQGDQMPNCAYCDLRDRLNSSVKT